MMENSSHLVVMAGGSGTRFWPKSTSKHPKQFLKFSSQDGAKTLLGETIIRFDGIVPEKNRWILTTRALAPQSKSAAPTLNILDEPQGRNTAPCIYWAAREIEKIDPKGVMLVMPSDHAIVNLNAFQTQIRRAIQWAKSHDDLITLGILPTHPETGYGYLKLKSTFDSDDKPVQLERFVEKPSLDKAIEFLKDGNYLWNGGMFVWRVDVILAEFDRHMPELKRAWDEAGGDVDRAYPQMTATSIDYGILEKSKSVVTFSLNCGWDDLGSWPSLESLADRMGTRHEAGVVVSGQALPIRSQGNIIDVPGKLVTLLDVNDFIVVEQGDALLVARKSSAQDLRLIVEAVKKARPDLA